ncbi:MAG: heat-inducible transcriptional repressor HrcA [Chloroflexota bacterium]|jgi:heat-inducible transcriptional repressor
MTDSVLTERQEHILRLMVRSYVETGSPVGSQTLVENFDLQVSSATVRNELSLLDDLGYLQQLHTSAGRIPTEKGYRYFVQRLVGEFELPLHERQMIRHQFHQTRLELDQWMRLAAAVLAHTSHGASIVTAPQPAAIRFRHVQLISTQGRLVLMILVMVGGQVQQQMLTLAEPVTQTRLSNVAAKLNGRYENADYGELVSRQHQHDDALERDVMKLILDGMARANRRGISNIYRDGLANIIEDEGTRQAVRVLEEGSYLASVLTETLEPDARGVQVVIGGEGRWEELRDCTMILARYGAIGQLTGAVAVLGPTRMAYGRNISAVRFVAELMSGLVSDYYLESPADGMTGGSNVNEVIN